MPRSRVRRLTRARRRAAAAALVVLAAAGCDAGAAPDVDDASPVDSIAVVRGDTVHIVADDDWQLLRAAADARRTLAEYRARVAHPPDGQSELALKGRFAEPGGATPRDSEIEHVWLDPVADAGGRLRGVVRSMPSALRRLHEGDTVVVRPEDVSDWFAVERDTLVAGYSIRVFRARLTADQRRARDSALGYVVLPDSVELVRRARPERAERGPASR